jgi:hypothetical protein
MFRQATGVQVWNPEGAYGKLAAREDEPVAGAASAWQTYCPGQWALGRLAQAKTVLAGPREFVSAWQEIPRALQPPRTVWSIAGVALP